MKRTIRITRIVAAMAILSTMLLAVACTGNGQGEETDSATESSTVASSVGTSETESLSLDFPPLPGDTEIELPVDWFD